MTAAPRRRFLCHLDPTVRETLILCISAQDFSPPPHILHDDEDAPFHADAGRAFFTRIDKVAREGPVDLVLLGVNSDLGDIAATGLRCFLECPILVLTSIVDPWAEHRLRRAPGATEIFHAPHIEPLLTRIAAHLRSIPGPPLPTSAP